MTVTAAIATLGCKTNQFESAALEERLRGAGYRIVPFTAGADLVVVNTCTVTAATDSQSRNLVRRARRLNERCRVVVTGCYAQVDPRALLEIPGVSLVLGNEEKRSLVELLTTAPEKSSRVADIRRSEVAGGLPIHSFAERSRAFVQIQNGCDAFCAYCIIPYARGPSRSVPRAEVTAQVQRLVDAGYPEIVLTGIHIGSYGLDQSPASDLTDLVRTLLRDTGVRRMRLGSLEPTEITEDLLDLLSHSEVLCPHLHIPLQAGSDAVLRRMNRSYDRVFFRDLVYRIHRMMPLAAIGLDVIAGFPGETEQEFADTCRLLEDLPISHLHVFPFSRRPGTPAATMPDQLSGSLIKARAARLRAIGTEKQAGFLRRFLGRELEVVVESGGEGEKRRGLSRHYLPVRFSGAGVEIGSIARVRAVSAEGGLLRGELLAGE